MTNSITRFVEKYVMYTTQERSEHKTKRVNAPKRKTTK